MKSGAEVKKRLLGHLDETRRKASVHAAAAAQAMIDYLAEATPVDTSKSLSNWTIGIGGPARDEIEAHSVGSGGSTRASSVQATREASRSKLRGKKPGDIIWVSNSDPNIVRLNAGSSKQAPAGFAEAAVMIGKAKLAEQIGSQRG